MVRWKRFSTFLLTGLAILALPAISDARPDRILNVVAAGDDEFRSNGDWEDRAREAIAEAGETLESDFGIRLNIVRFESWQTGANEYDLAALHDELIEDVPATGTDLVIGFTGRDGATEPRRLVRLGHSDTPGQYLVVTDRAGDDLGLVLRHEIGHAFGLVHVKVPSIMNEQVHRDRPDFDSVSAAILRNNRDLKFGNRDSFAGCELGSLHALYDELAQRGDDVADLYAVLGDSYRRRGEMDQAAGVYDQAADLNPKLLNPRLGRGMIAMQTKQYSEAVRWFEEARSLDSEIKGLDANLGLAYSALGQKESAILAYRRAVDLDPRDVNALNNLGLLYMDAGDNEASEEAFLDALEARPGFCEAHNNLGLLYQKMNALEQSVRAFEESLECRETALVHRNLASALLSLGRRAEAKSHLEASLRMDPDQKDAADLRQLSRTLR